jgi:hypothetical protein
MRYRLRTLLIAVAIGLPILALWLLFPAALPTIVWLGTVALAAGELLRCWKNNPDKC